MTAPTPGLQIGRLLDVPDVPLYLKGPGLTAHTLIVGQSGSGKSFMLGRLLEEIAAKTTARIVILDPNSDFVRFSEVEPETWIKFKPFLDPTDSEANFRAAWAPVSFSLLTSRARGALLLKNAGVKAEPPTLSWEPANAFEAASELGFDTRTDVDEVFALNNIVHGEAQKQMETFAKFVEQAEASWQDAKGERERAAGAVYARAAEMQNLDVWSQAPGEGSVRANVKELLGTTSPAGRLLCIDLASLAKQDERLMVANAALKQIWTAGRKTWIDAITKSPENDTRCPVFIVVDEAHNLAPAQPASPMARSVLDMLARIATEGRKYGIFLIMVTQRPSRLDETLRTQCDNLCLLKMNNRHDLDLVQNSFGFIPSGWAQRAMDFKLGDVLFAGGLTERPVYGHSAPRRTAEGGRNIQDAAWLSYLPKRDDAATK